MRKASERDLEPNRKIECGRCRRQIELSGNLTGKKCPYCGTLLRSVVADETAEFVPIKSDDACGGKRATHAADVAADSGSRRAFVPTTTDIDGRPLPRRLGKYQLLEVFGRGGMGVVYRARQVDIERTVALKIIRTPSGFPTEQEALRFVAEAQITGQIEHPNIVPVHDMGTDEDGRPYFVMKFVNGRSLSSILRGLRRGNPELKKEFTRARLLEIFLAVGQAVTFAHARGVLHRDLKPANVMIGEFGEVLLMDWGLAKPFERFGSALHPIVTEERSQETAPTPKTDSRRQERVRTVFDSRGMKDTVQGVVSGTPEYMAPEQATGRPEALRPSADVYGLGAMLFEILTQHPPHEDADTQRLMRKVALEPARFPPRQKNQEVVPTALRAIALKALSADPTRRYPSVAALVRDVRAFMEDRPTAARPDYPWEIPLRFLRKHAAASFAGAIILALFAFGAFVTAQALRTADAEKLKAQKNSLDLIQARFAAEETARTEAEKARAEAEARIKAEGERLAIQEQTVQAAQRLRAAMIPYLDGRDLTLRRRFTLAIEQLQRATRLDPTFPLFQMALGEAYMRMDGKRNAQLALECFETAARLAKARGRNESDGGEEARAWVLAGDTAAQVLGDADLALNYYQAAAKIAPEDPYGLTGRARAELLKNNADEALRLAQSALQKADWLWEAHLLAGRILAGQTAPNVAPRDLHLALRHLDSAVDYAADSPEVWSARAQALLSKGEKNAALADLDELLRLTPDDAEALTRRAELLAALERPNEALRDWDRAVGLCPTDYALRLARVKLRLAIAPAAETLPLKTATEAEDDLAEAIRLRPLATQPLTLRAQLRLRRGDFRAAVNDADAVLKLQPQERTARLVRAEAHRRLKEFDAAAADYAAALAEDADIGEAWRDYGAALLNAGKTHEALKAWQKYLQKYPDDATVWQNVARILAEAKPDAVWFDPSGALTAVQKADELTQGRSFDAKLLKAEVLWSAGRREEAGMILEREAFPLSPTDPRLHALREKFRQKK
jgi:serine/threonine protein kinase/Tfp pilus assembly protein PilF